jgi:hypothetical protein
LAGPDLQRVQLVGDEKTPLAQIGLIFFFGLDVFKLSEAILLAKARDAMASAYGPEQLILF